MVNRQHKSGHGKDIGRKPDKDKKEWNKMPEKYKLLEEMKAAKNRTANAEESWKDGCPAIDFRSGTQQKRALLS